MDRKKNSLLIAIFCFFLTAPLFAQQNNQSIPDMQVIGDLKSVSDELKSIAESSALPLPENGLNGPVTTDLAYQSLKILLGKPIANLSLSFTNADPAGSSANVDNPNVLVYLLSMMAGLGLVGVLVSAAFTVTSSIVSVSTSAKLFGSGKGSEGSPFAFLMARLGFSTILNTPLPVLGGMATSQAIMLFFALLGIGLGSALFSGVANRMLNQPLITYSPVQGHVFFIKAAKAVTCLDYFTEKGFIAPENSLIEIQDDVALGFGVKKMVFGKNSECGYYSFTINDIEQEDQSPMFGASSLISGAGSFTNDAIAEIYKVTVFNEINKTISGPDFYQTIASIGGEGEDFVNGVYTPTANAKSKLSKAYDNIDKAIEKALSELRKSASNCGSPGEGAAQANKALLCQDEVLKKSIADNGFMLAGTYTYILNRRQSVLSDLIENTYPSFTYDEDTIMDTFGIDSDSDYFKEFQQRMLMTDTVFGAISSTTSSSLAKDLNKVYESTTTDGALSQMLGDSLYTSMKQVIKIGYWGEEASFQNPEPIVQLQQIGNIMMGLPLALIAGDSILDLFPGKSISKKIIETASSGSTLGKFLNPDNMLMTMMMASIFQAIIVGGFFLGVLVPMIPMMMWNIAVFGYLSYIILVVIGVPFMIAAKPLNDGEGFIGGVKTGYMMAFNLFIRPPAMVIGLIVAMALSRLFSWFINATYFESFQIFSSGSFSVAAVVGLPLGYVIFQLTAIYKSYSMINEVPAFIGKMTETDRAHSDFGEEQEKNRVAGLFVQAGNTFMSTQKQRARK